MGAAIVRNEGAVDELERIGFSAYEAQTYATLVQYDSVPLTVLASESSIPRSRIYGVVPSLDAQGHAETFTRDEKRHASAREDRRR